VVFKNLILLILTLVLPTIAHSNENWKNISFNMKLINLLDRKDGYCIDVVGSGDNIRFNMPLNAHNCKKGLYADEAVVYQNNGNIYFPAYNSCLTVMGLNNNALPYNALMIKECNIDKPFLKSTTFQKFIINEKKQIQLYSTSLCITVGNISKETYSKEHRWRSLYMDNCLTAKLKLSQWHLVKQKL
jgi:hypothetical protein